MHGLQAVGLFLNIVTIFRPLSVALISFKKTPNRIKDKYEELWKPLHLSLFQFQIPGGHSDR